MRSCRRATGKRSLCAPRQATTGDSMPYPRCRYGDYVNGEAGKPLFVSLIVYLDAEWSREWDAGTMGHPLAFCAPGWDVMCMYMLRDHASHPASRHLLPPPLLPPLCRRDSLP